MQTLSGEEIVTAALYEARKRVDAAVKENFGSCPNTHSFDELMEKMRALEEQVKDRYPSDYSAYANKYY